MADKSVAFRLSLKDGELVRAALERLGKDGEAAIRKIDKAARDTSSGGGLSALDGALAKLKTGVVGLTGGLSVGALVAFGRTAIDAAGGLGELAEQLGVSTDKLQVYQYAAGQVGLKQEELETGLAQLTRRMGDAVGGNDAMIQSFTRLGVKLLDANGKVRGTDAILADIADALAEIDDPAQKAAAAVELFGKTGQRLLPLLSQGSAALAQYEAAARRAGSVWSPAEIAAADKFSDEVARLERESTKLAQSLVVNGGVLDGLNALMGYLTGKDIEGDTWLSIALRAARENADALRASMLALPGIGPLLAAPSARVQRGVDATLGGSRYRRSMHALLDEQQLIGSDEAQRLLGEAFSPTAAGPNRDPVSAKTVEAQRKAEEQIRKTTEALAAQGDQFARTAEQRAVYDALAQAGIKTSDAEIKAARDLLATYPEFATEREKAIVQIADLAAQNHRKAEAEKAGADAVREHEREQKRLTETQKKASEGVDDILAGLREEQTQLRLSERDRFIRQKSLEAERKLLEAGLPLQDERIKKIREEAGATYDLTQEVERAREARREFEREAQKQAEEQRELLLEPYREAWRSIQSLGADALGQLFDGGLKDAKDFWKAFLDIAKKTLLQIAAAEINVAIQGVFSTSGAPGGQGGISGLIGQIFGGGSSPIAGTGNLPTNSGGLGGGLGGGLFGSGSIGSFLSRPLSSFGIGSPGLDPTGASAYLGLAEAGGIGGFLGDLSLGQGLGFLGGAAGGIGQLLQGGTANTIGGITSLIGAGVSLIPGVGQILGPLISIGGGLLGSIFGKKKPKIPIKQAQLYTGAPGIQTGGAGTIFQGEDFVHSTPFGVLGYYGTGTNKRFDDPSGDAGELLRAVADMDRAIAELLTQSEIDRVAAALQGQPGIGVEWKKAFDNEGFDIVKDRLDVVLRELYGGTVASEGLAGIARGNENIEELINRAGEVIQIGNVIKGIGINVTDAEKALKAINEQFDELTTKAEQYGFAVAEVAKLEAERRKQVTQLAIDFNKGVADQLLGYTDPYALAQQQLAESQDKRRQEALYLIEQYQKGLLDTLVDINKLEELFGKERVQLAEQALEAIGADWKSFREELLFGPLSAKSNREQYELAFAEYQDVRGRAQAAFAANDNLDPALAAEFQKEALLALQWSRTYNASATATASLYQQILDLAQQFGDLDVLGAAVPGMATGGALGPGLVRVGERGAELIRLFQPARVYSREASDALLSGGGEKLDRLVDAIDQLLRLVSGGQVQSVAMLREAIGQLAAQRRDAELRGATQSATGMPAARRRNAAGGR